MTLNTIVVIGDSLTYGSNGSNTLTRPLHLRLASKYPGLNIVNLGVPGESATAVYNRRATANIFTPFRVVVWAGVNDIALDVSAATLETTLQNIFTYYSGLGYEVWAMTITPVDTDSSGRNTVRDTVNAWIMALPSGVSKAIDAWTAVRDPSDPGVRLPAYADGSSIVHLTDAAYAAIVELFP